MKKIISVLLALSMLFSLVSCGQANTAEAPANANEAVPVDVPTVDPADVDEYPEYEDGEIIEVIIPETTATAVGQEEDEVDIVETDGFDESWTELATASVTTPGKVYDFQASQRLTNLVNKLNGKFFTSTGNTSCHKNYESSHPTKNNHEKDSNNCNLKVVIKSQWFKDTGLLRPNNKPSNLYYNGGTMVGWGFSCKAFASYANWYAYAQSSNDGVTLKKLATGKQTKEFMSKARPGDIIANTHHFWIFLCQLEDGSGYRYIDCNRNLGHGNCEIKTGVFYYKDVKNITVVISRAKNYTEHKHDYDTFGVCKTCGYDYYKTYKYYKTGVTTKAVSGTITADPKVNNIIIRVRPYDESGTLVSKVKSGKSYVYSTMRLSTAEVNAIVKNHKNEYWYQITISGYSVPLYVKASEVPSSLLTYDLSFSNVSKPKNNVKAGTAAKTTVKGTVSSPFSKIKEVTAAIYNKKSLSDAQISNLKNNKYTAKEAYSLAGSKAKYTGHKTLDAASFNLNVFDSKLLFGKLPGGATYIYVITATDANGVTKTWYYEFTLKK